MIVSTAGWGTIVCFGIVYLRKSFVEAVVVMNVYIHWHMVILLSFQGRIADERSSQRESLWLVLLLELIAGYFRASQVSSSVSVRWTKW